MTTRPPEGRVVWGDENEANPGKYEWWDGIQWIPATGWWPADTAHWCREIRRTEQWTWQQVGEALQRGQEVRSAKQGGSRIIAVKICYGGAVAYRLGTSDWWYTDGATIEVLL